MKGLDQQKEGMIAALWANSNWDDDKGSRKNAIAEISESYQEAIEAIEDAMSKKDRPEEEKISDDNPFFSAAKRGLSKVDQRVRARGGNVDAPIESDDEIDYMKDLDQA